MKLVTIAAAATVALAVLIVPAATASADPVRYDNCQAVRDAGKAPLHKTDPGYRKELDRDDDGLACETGDPASNSPAGATATGTATKAPAQPADPCSVMSDQAATKLRPLVEPLLTEDQKKLLSQAPDALLVSTMRLKAKCTGTPAKLSDAELLSRMCSIATVDGLKSLGALIGAGEQAKEKATTANVAAVRGRLGCDKAVNPTSSPATSNPTHRSTPLRPGRSYDQIGTNRVPRGSVATGG